MSFGLIIAGVVIYSVKSTPAVSTQGEYREMCTEEAVVRPTLGEPTEITYHTSTTVSSTAGAGGRAPGGRVTGARSGKASPAATDGCSLQVAKFHHRSKDSTTTTQGNDEVRQSLTTTPAEET